MKFVVWKTNKKKPILNIIVLLSLRMHVMCMMCPKMTTKRTCSAHSPMNISRTLIVMPFLCYFWFFFCLFQSQKICTSKCILPERTVECDDDVNQQRCWILNKRLLLRCVHVLWFSFSLGNRMKKLIFICLVDFDFRFVHNVRNRYGLFEINVWH